jgi:hypothetical protein
LLATVACVLVAGTVVASWFAVRADKNAEEALQNQRVLERQLLRSEWLVYAGQIAQAQHDWQDGNWREAWQALDNCRKDFRGWEYDYLYRRFTGNPRTFRGHTGFVNSVAFSPDGKRLVSGDDEMVKVWDVQTGQELRFTRGGFNHGPICMFIAGRLRHRQRQRGQDGEGLGCGEWSRDMLSPRAHRSCQ